MADIQFPNILFDPPPGTFNAQLLDNNGAPSTVLDAGTEIQINCDWVISPLAALLMGGQWEVAAYVDSIGPGPEQLVASAVVPLTGATTYNALLRVPANTLPNNPGPGQSGAYKVVVLLTHRNFGSVSDVAAVVEFPVVRIG
jgi:hypothetical protein